MSLYDDIEIDTNNKPVASSMNVKKEGDTENVINVGASSKMATPSTTNTTTIVNKINLSFLKSQLEAKKVLLHNAAVQVRPNGKSNISQTAQPLQTTINIKPVVQPQKGIFKLKPHKALPLPLDSGGAFTLVPKALKEDKVFLFGEITVEDEYNPTAPTDYASFKQKREQQKLKEKIAKEIADRLAKEATEEEEKRRTGAAIAPPSILVDQDRQIEGEGQPNEDEKKQQFEPQKLHQFGRGASKGLGVAASIMSKMGYRHGAGLGAKEQGISRPLEVQRTGKNIGLILGEGGAAAVVTTLDDLTGNQEQNG